MEVEGNYSEPILRKTLEWLKEAESFAVEQAPLLVEEVLWFETITHFLYCFMFLGFVGITTYCIHLIAVSDGLKGNEEATFGCFLMLLDVVFSIGIVYNLVTILQIQVAPRLFLIEYFSDMVS